MYSFVVLIISGSLYFKASHHLSISWCGLIKWTFAFMCWIWSALQCALNLSFQFFVFWIAEWKLFLNVNMQFSLRDLNQVPKLGTNRTSQKLSFYNFCFCRDLSNVQGPLEETVLLLQSDLIVGYEQIFSKFPSAIDRWKMS